MEMKDERPPTWPRDAQRSQHNIDQHGLHNPRPLCCLPMISRPAQSLRIEGPWLGPIEVSTSPTATNTEVVQQVMSHPQTATGTQTRNPRSNGLAVILQFWYRNAVESHAHNR